MHDIFPFEEMFFESFFSPYSFSMYLLSSGIAIANNTDDFMWDLSAQFSSAQNTVSEFCLTYEHAAKISANKTKAVLKNVFIKLL